jgi:hypothetical protein
MERKVAEYYKTFSALPVKKDKTITAARKTQLLYKLMKPPKTNKGVEIPHRHTESPGETYQADILELPADDITEPELNHDPELADSDDENDENYEEEDSNLYHLLLVVIDTNNSRRDFEPMTNKIDKTVKLAFKKIFKRGILKEPQILIQTDSGREFKNSIMKSISISAVL